MSPTVLKSIKSWSSWKGVQDTGLLSASLEIPYYQGRTRASKFIKNQREGETFTIGGIEIRVLVVETFFFGI